MLLLPTLIFLTVTTTTVALNPQPLSPAHHINHDGERDLNPQPLPPGRRISIYERDSCAPSYVKCAPPGATGTSIPAIGPSVKGLYLNVLESVQGDKLGLQKKDWVNCFEDDVDNINLDVNVGTDKKLMAEKLEKLKRQVGIDVSRGVDAAVEEDVDTDEHSNDSTDSERVPRRMGINVDVNLPMPAAVDPNLEFELRKRATTVQMCCATGTQCLLLKGFNVPFCWDKFTTNFFLPFSSYGSITTGNYTSPAPLSAPPNTPSRVNLLSGIYTRPDGSSGNIYSEDEAAKPDTATLGSLMPTPWTSAGVGSAIPASALGGIATWTTVIDGTTVEPSVVSGSTMPGTTISPITTIVTGFEATATSTRIASSTSSKGGAASGVSEVKEWVIGMAVAVAGLLGAVLGL